MDESADDAQPARPDVALVVFRVFGAILGLSFVGLVVMALQGVPIHELSPSRAFALKVLCYSAVASVIGAACAAACAFYGKWAALLGILALASAAAVYFSDEGRVLLWLGLCGGWSVLCLLIAAVGHSMRRKSLYTREVDETTAD
ncbi:MAG TPA: hypothetical protein VEJ63_01060 [Planctomycetota bacterium]|nr:hypothetical protein [Planctomycetota bacterium]